MRCFEAKFGVCLHCDVMALTVNQSDMTWGFRSSGVISDFDKGGQVLHTSELQILVIFRPLSLYTILSNYFFLIWRLKISYTRLVEICIPYNLRLLYFNNYYLRNALSRPWRGWATRINQSIQQFFFILLTLRFESLFWIMDS